MMDLKLYKLGSLVGLGLVTMSAPISASVEFFVQPGTTTDLDDTFELRLGADAILEDFESSGPTVEEFQGVVVRAVDGEDIDSPFRVFNSSAFAYPGRMESNALLNGVLGGGYYPMVEFSFSTPVEAFGVWIYDDGYQSIFRIGVESITGSTYYSEFLDNQAGGLEGFIGAISALPLARIWVEGHLPSSTAENPQLDFTQPFELDHVSLQYYPEFPFGDTRIPIDATGEIVLEDGAESGAQAHVRFESTAIVPESSYRVQGSINLVDWADLDLGSSSESGAVMATTGLDPSSKAPLFFRPVEYNYKNITEEDSTQLKSLLDTRLLMLANSVKSQLSIFDSLSEDSDLPDLLLELVNTLFAAMSPEEQREAMETMLNSGLLKQVDDAGLSASSMSFEEPVFVDPVNSITPKSTDLAFESVVTKTAYYESNLKWEDIVVARAYIAHARELEMIAYENALASLAASGSSFQTVVGSIIGTLVNMGDIIYKGSRPSVPEKLYVEVEGGAGALNPLFYGEEPYPKLRFYMDFRSYSGFDAEAFKALLSLIPGAYGVVYQDAPGAFGAGFVDDFTSALGSGASLSGFEYPPFDPILQEFRELNPELYDSFLAKVQAIALKMQEQSTVRALRVEVPPNFALRPRFTMKPPSEFIPVDFSPSTGVVGVKNSRQTGDGWIGFLFTDPLMPEVNLFIAGEDRLYYNVPNEAPQFVSNANWQASSVANYNSQLTFTDRESNPVLVDEVTASYGEVTWDPSTQILHYTLDDRAKSIFQLGTWSYTTTLPFSVIVNREETTDFEAHLNFPIDSSDTVQVTFRDNYNEPQMVEVHVPLGNLLDSRISGLNFSLVQDPSTIGWPADREIFSYLDAAYKGQYYGVPEAWAKYSQSFRLRLKQDPVPPAIDTYSLWFQVDLEAFQLSRNIRVVPTVGDAISPWINSITAAPDYARGNYGIRIWAQDNVSAISHYYYKILDESAPYPEGAPHPDESGWQAFPAEVANINIEMPLMLTDADPHFVEPVGLQFDSSPEGYKRWNLAFWVKDAEGNVSHPFVTNLPEPKTYFTDPRDGHRYETIIIDGKEWFRKDLYFERSYYEARYTQADIPNAIPPGWNAPSEADYSALMAFINVGIIETDPDIIYGPGSRLKNVLQLREEPASGGGSAGAWWTRSTARGVVGWLMTSTFSGNETYPAVYLRFDDGVNNYSEGQTPPEWVGGSAAFGSGMGPSFAIALRPWRPAGN